MRHPCQPLSTPAKSSGGDTSQIHPPATPGCRQQGMERAGLGQPGRKQTPATHPAFNAAALYPQRSLPPPSVRLLWGKDRTLGHTAPSALQSWISLAPSQLATTSPMTGKVAFKSCPQTILCLVGPLPASAVTLARQDNSLKKSTSSYLEVAGKIKQCPIIVLQSPSPWCFHKLLDNIGGWGVEETKKKLWGNSWLDSGKEDQTSASNKRHLHISHLFFIIYRSNLPKFSKGE